MPMVSFDSSPKDTMQMAYPCHDMQSQQSPEELQVSPSVQLCSMDNCDCWHVGTANIPNDFTLLLAVLVESADFTAVAMPNIRHPFIPPHQKPPRNLSA